MIRHRRDAPTEARPTTISTQTGRKLRDADWSKVYMINQDPETAIENLRNRGEWPKRNRMTAWEASGDFDVLAAFQDGLGGWDNAAIDKYLGVPWGECDTFNPSTRVVDEWCRRGLDMSPIGTQDFIVWFGSDSWSSGVEQFNCKLIYKHRGFAMFKKENSNAADFWIAIHGKEACLGTSMFEVAIDRAKYIINTCRDIAGMWAWLKLQKVRRAQDQRQAKAYRAKMDARTAKARATRERRLAARRLQDFVNTPKSK